MCKYVSGRYSATQPERVFQYFAFCQQRMNPIQLRPWQPQSIAGLEPKSCLLPFECCPSTAALLSSRHWTHCTHSMQRAIRHQQSSVAPLTPGRASHSKFLTTHSKCHARVRGSGVKGVCIKKGLTGCNSLHSNQHNTATQHESLLSRSLLPQVPGLNQELAFCILQFGETQGPRLRAALVVIYCHEEHGLNPWR